MRKILQLFRKINMDGLELLLALPILINVHIFTESIFRSTDSEPSVKLSAILGGLFWTMIFSFGFGYRQKKYNDIAEKDYQLFSQHKYLIAINLLTTPLFLILPIELYITITLMIISLVVSFYLAMKTYSYRIEEVFGGDRRKLEASM
ncbi:MAG: hypothetical protein Kapaf2KO_03810 [Candidatus Kapaibacteriales bacterium]